MVRSFLNGGNLFTKPLNWIFGKIQFFENCWHKFHFCQHEINYTTFTSAFFCWREIILVRKTGKSTCYHKTFEKHSKIRKIKIYMWTVSSLKCSRVYFFPTKDTKKIKYKYLYEMNCSVYAAVYLILHH